MNTKKGFRFFTDEECKVHHDLLIINSNLRWESALLLANKGDYGGAIANHINSIEEHVKSVIMGLDSKGFEFRKMPNIDVLMKRNHIIRHFIGFLAFTANTFFNTALDFAPKNKSIEDLEKLLSNNSQLEQLVKLKMYRMIVKMKHAYSDFENLERKRQNGLYVDVDSSPFDFSAEEYEEIRNKLLSVKLTIKFFLESYLKDDPEFEDEINNLKKTFIESNWYSLLDSLIVEGNRSKSKLFGKVKSHFSKENKSQFKA